MRERLVLRLVCFRLFSVLLLSGAAARLSLAAEDQPTPAPVSEKVLKYHAMLGARPEPGYLFDRFYNSWLDESTVDALDVFLRKKVDTSQTTADRLLLAIFYAKKGDDVAALKAFHEALAHDPANAATWYHKALIEASTLDFDTAVADLKKARQQSPDDKLAIQIDKQLGKLYARNRQTDDALKVWQTLLKANPNDDELYEDLVELHIDEGLFKEAAALEEQLVGNTKDQYLAVTRRLRLGDIYNRSGDRAKAVAAYTTALDAVGNDSWLEREILAQLDQVFRREDDLAGLKRLYGELLKKYEKRFAIRRRHAQLLVELGEPEPAIEAYREILKLTPGERATREEFVGVLAKLGKQDEAIKELESLSALHEKDAELRFHLASLLQEAKKTDQAIAAVDRYLETSDGSEYAHLRAARLLERFDDKAAAARLYKKMTQKFAESSAAQEAYAAFLYANGKKSEAIERWQALAKNGDVAHILQIARTLSTRNENDAALALLKDGFEKAKTDPLYLGQMVTTALALKQYDEAMPWANERVRRAEQPADLETAVDQAATVIERADKRETEAQRLESLEMRSVPETCLLAELYERTDESSRADATLKPAAEKGNLLAISEQIRLFTERREWGAAASATHKILELPGGRKSLNVRRLVELYQRDFQLEEGLKWIDEWKRLSPGSTTPWITEVRMLQGLGRNDDALKVLRSAVLKFDQDEDLRVRLAEFYAENTKPADAMRIYWQLYEENEDVSSKLRWAQELAKLAQQQGTVQQLVQDFDGRVRANRQSIVPLLSLSEIYRITDDYEGRRRALTAAAKVKPDDIQLLQQIARVEEQDGDWRAAIATLERAVSLDKTNRTREQIAQLHLANGDEEAGYAMLLELVGAANADPRTVEMTADTLCGTREWERAADFLQRRINDYPADYRLRYLLAVALEEASRTNEAVQQFLQLLSDQEELPTKKKSAPSQMPQMGSYYDMIRQIMPADAFEWLQLAQYRYSAYAYRQQQSYGAPVIRSVAGGMQRSAVQIPSSIDNVRPMAVSHLLSIAATLDDDKLDDVCKELESCGIKQAKVLSRLDPNRQDFAAILPDILDKDPDNETALALMAVQSMGIRTDALSPYCAKAFEKFRNNRPQLAFMAAVQAGIAAARTAGTDESDANNGEDAASNKYLDEALKIGATFDHPNPMIVMSLTMVLGGRNIGGQDAEIGDTYRQKFSQLMIQWYPELSKSPQYGSWTFYYAAQSLVKNSDPASYMRFLDDEVARWQQGALGGRAGVITAQMAYGRQPRLLPSASFPPMQLSDFPPNVLALFAANQDPNYSPYGNQTATFDEDTAKKVGPLLEKVTSPILRILFAHKAELPDRIDAELKTLLAAKSPVLDAYLLAASLAAEKENHAEAVKLLETSQYLPMKQDVRQQVDAAIVASVLTLKQKSAAIDEHLLDVGQKASLRLRRARLDGQQRTELIAAMEELGLKKEADKLDSLAAASNTPRSNLSPAVAYSGPASRTGSDQIAKLIGQGKRDAAARQLANDVTAQVRQLLANPQNASYYRRQMFRQVRQQIDGNGLTDDVLKLLDPGDSKNVQKFVDYGIACDLLGRPQAARTALEQAVTLRPKDDAARMQLILLITTEDPPSAAKQLTQISKSGRGAFGQMIAGRLQDWESSFEERIGFARLAVEYLKVLEPGDVAQAYWIDNLMTMIGRQMSGRRGGLPSLYAVNPSERSQSANQVEIMTERRKVHDALCEQMLSMPELARIGFRHLLAATQAQNKPVDAFAEHAVRILTSEADAKPNRPAVRQTTYYVNGESEVRFRGPEEFLARRAWKSGEWNEIDETLLPKLAGDKNRQARERLTQLASLYRCDEAQFSGEAEKAVKHFRPLQPGQANEGLAIAVDVWADRGLKVDLQPLIIKQLKLDSTAQNSYQAPGYVVRYIEGTAQQSDRERQLAFLEEVAAVYLGPAEKRNDFLKKNYNPRQINWGTPNGRIHVFGQLMEQLCQRSELLFIVLEHLEQFDEPKPVQNFEYRVGEAIQKLEPMGAEASMDLLRRSPWLADLEHFRPLVVGGRGTASPLVLLLRQQSKTAESNAKLRELVQAEQTQGGKTFGGGLVLAALEQEKTSTALLDYVGGQLEAIRKLPDRQQQSLAALLRELVNSDAIKQKDLNGAAKAAQEWILGSYAEQAQSLLARAEKAKRLEELGITNSQVDSFFRQNLAELIGGDGASAAPVFLRVCELCREAQRRGEWHMYFGNGESLEGFVLNQSSHAVQPYDWPMFRFVVDVVNTSGKRQVEAGYAVANIARGAIQTGGGRVPKASDGKATPIEDQVHAIYEELGAVLKERPSSLFIVPFYEQVHSELENPASNEKLRAWAEKEMSGGKYPELASNMHAVLALVAEERDPTGKQNGVKTRREMSDYHKRFGAIVHDEKLSLTWRVYVAAFIADRQSVRLPLELARDLVALYTQALNADVPITNNQNRSLTQCVLSLAHESESEKLLNEWRDAWQRRYLGQPARQASGPRQFENLNRLTDSSALGRALEVYVANESPQLPDGAKRLLAVYDDQIGHLPTAYAILLRSHHPEEAAQLLRGHVLKLDVDWPNIEETRYDTAIESLLPTMLEKLERDDERYLAQVLFAAMPDEGQPNDDKEGTVKPTARDERLSQLAGKFAHAPFRDATVKKLCLVLLSGSDSAGKLVAGDVAAAYDASAILSAAGGPDRTRLKFESRLAQCHFRHLLREGKVEPLIDLLKRLSANPSDDDYQFGETVSPLIECVCDEIADAQRVKWSADACLSLGESLGNTLKGREYVNINIFEKFGTTLVALYCQAGKGEDLKTLREKLSNYNRSRMENSGLRDDVWSAGLVLNGPASPETRESRLRFLQNVLRYAFDQKWIERNGSPYRMRGQSERNFLSNVVKARLLSPDELKTHGLKALDGIGSQDEPAYAKAALANWLQSQKDYEKAAEVWRSMITFSANAKQVSRNEANYILGLATSLKNLARYDEALKALSMLEGKEFDQSLKVSYDQYKRDIETAKKNAAKPAANEPADGKSTRTAPADRSPNPAMLAVALPTLAV